MYEQAERMKYEGQMRLLSFHFLLTAGTVLFYALSCHEVQGGVCHVFRFRLRSDPFQSGKLLFSSIPDILVRYTGGLPTLAGMLPIPFIAFPIVYSRWYDLRLKAVRGRRLERVKERVKEI